MSADQYWFEEDDVRHKFYGVFEGGGAKGVAYNGALAAMRLRGCWFEGVAGASAGAITAALVAAGLSPEDIAAETDTALSHVSTGMWAGLRRLQQETGYFPSQGLRAWLEGLLSKQVAIKTGTPPASPVTFEDLFHATNIELNIVAANLSLKCEVIFSHTETPKCGVADAVVASSSIPFAFASHLLRVVDGGTQITHHTIVDGGVWSNFPMHVFEDEAFRCYYSREPAVIDPTHILGFVLHEGVTEPPPRGADVRFVEDASKKLFTTKERMPALERSPSDEHADTAPPLSTGSRIAAWLLYPFALLGRISQWNGGVEAGRWPEPSSAVSRNLLHSIDGLLGGMHTPVFGVLVIIAVGIGAWKVVDFVALDQMKAISVTDWRDPMSYAARLFGVSLTVVAIAVAILISFATLLGVIANYVLLRAGRRILYGLATTYVAGPGAPAWAIEKKRNIVALPIPAGVTTLTFALSGKQRAATIAAAREATLAKLKVLVPEEEVAI